MKTGLKRILTETGIFLVPLLSITILGLLFYIPRLSGFWNFLRMVPFYAGIYFWQSQRPDAFNMFSAFLLGVVADALTGTPLGVNVAAFMVLYFLSVHLSAYFNIRKFSYSWLLFSIATLATMLFKAVTVSLFYRQLVPFNALLFEFMLAFSLYPILARFYIWVERRYIHLEGRYEKI